MATAAAVREFRAEGRFQRVSPQKARLVLDLIKGLGVEQALQTVAFTKKGCAPMVEKILRSAVQNANHLSDEQGLDVDLDRLYVKQAVANDGPRMKRIRPAPMGRAFRYQRRMAHIVIALAELGEDQAARGDREGKKAVAAAGTKGAGAKAAAGKKKQSA